MNMNTDQSNQSQNLSGVSTRSLSPTQAAGLAGRGLDAAVADKVMNVACNGERTPDHAKWCSRHGTGERVGAPFYSSDIAAAMKVVENLKARGWRIIIEWAGRMEQPTAPLLWEVIIKSYTADGWWYLAREESETLPEAICLAALKAVGKQST